MSLIKCNLRFRSPTYEITNIKTPNARNIKHPTYRPRYIAHNHCPLRVSKYPKGFFQSYGTLPAANEFNNNNFQELEELRIQTFNKKIQQNPEYILKEIG